MKVSNWMSLAIALALAVSIAPCLVHAAGARDPAQSRLGQASWYGHELARRRTASGERFDPERLTCAHRTLPLGTRVRVTNLHNGRTVLVRITDRGPYVGGREIDLSLAAARVLGMVARGLAPVLFEPL